MQVRHEGREKQGWHLLVLLGGNLLQKVGDCLALWDVEAQALKVGHHLPTRPMKHQIACKDTV